MKKVERALPLSQQHYLILVSLAEGPRHGYAVKKQVLELTDGKVRLGAGSLYRSIRQLADEGLIEQAPGRPAAALDDERRVYYRLTRKGRRVVALETERLRRLLQATSRVLAHGSSRDS